MPASHCTRGRKTKTTTLFHNLHETVINFSGIGFGEKVMSSFVSETCFFFCAKKAIWFINSLPAAFPAFPNFQLKNGSLGIRSDHRGTGISSPFDTSSNSSKESSPVDMAKDGCSSLALSQMILFFFQLKEFGVRFCLFVWKKKRKDWGYQTLFEKMIPRLSRGLGFKVIGICIYIRI